MKCLTFCFFLFFLFVIFCFFVQHGPPEAGKKKCGGHEELGEGEELVVNSTRMIPPNIQKHKKYKNTNTEIPNANTHKYTRRVRKF